MGIITPKSEWKSRINHSFRKACDIKLTTTLGQAGQALPSPACTEPVITGPDSCPGTPESMNEVIVNMVAVHQGLEASQCTAFDSGVKSPPGVSGEGVLDVTLHGGHYCGTNCSQLSMGKRGMVTSCSNLEEIAWNGTGETQILNPIKRNEQVI